MMVVTVAHVIVQMAAILVTHTAATVMIVQILDQAVLITRVTAHYLVQSRVLMKTVQVLVLVIITSAIKVMAGVMMAAGA
jgi:hypothetical protein